jgi:hypothetical protein
MPNLDEREVKENSYGSSQIKIFRPSRQHKTCYCGIIKLKKY